MIFFDELFIIKRIISISNKGILFMKKFFKGLLITLVVLIILPIALLFIFVFDTGKMSITYDDNFTQQTMSQKLVVDSLDKTVSDKQIKFSLTEQDINNYIYAGIKNNDKLNQYLTQLAIDIKEDSYVLNVSGKAWFFETRAKLTTTLSKETVVSSDGEKEAFVLTVKKMTLGRLTKLKEVISFFLSRFINNETIDALTSSIHLHSDLKNSKLFIYTEDLREMINKGLTGGSGASDFYFSFINDFLDLNLINIDFYGGESLSIDVNLERLTGNDYDASLGENVYYPMNYDDTTTKLTINGEEKKLSLDVIREALTYLMNNQIVNMSNINQVSDFLFNGYNGTSAPDVNLTSIGIPVKETYKGFNLVTSEDVDELLTNAASTFDGYSISLDSFDIANLKESEINLFMKTQSALGNKFFLQREVADSQNKINYIALDNAYMNLYNGAAIVSVGLNINGLETWATLKMDADTSNTDAHKLVFKPADLYFGKASEKLALSDDSKKVIYETLAEAVNQSSFKFERDGKLTISFDSLFTNVINNIDTSNPIMAEYKTFLQNNADIKVVIEGDAVTDNSTVKIQAVRRA